MTLKFTGPARRLEDLDLPRIGAMIGVGEDVIHAVIDVEAPKDGFDAQGRPRILFEPHVFYRNLPAGRLREQAVKAGLACKNWGQIPYGKESEQYPKLLRALLIDETAALKACSWGRGQVLGENHVAAGYETVQAMVADFTLDEDNHLEAAIRFIRANRLDDELRVLDKLARRVTPDDCRPFVRGYNGAGYEKNGYHTKFAAALNRWRGIPDTPWSPDKPEGYQPKPAPVPPVPTTGSGVKPPPKPIEMTGDLDPDTAPPGFFARMIAGFRAALGG